ncbi:hypothetical protein J6590_006831 [Homalodisca vitripennis]|nr:hypothetical protein J6590_006831 [Homalodisca vitripennis]
MTEVATDMKLKNDRFERCGGYSYHIHQAAFPQTNINRTEGSGPAPSTQDFFSDDVKVAEVYMSIRHSGYKGRTSTSSSFACVLLYG